MVTKEPYTLTSQGIMVTKQLRRVEGLSGQGVWEPMQGATRVKIVTVHRDDIAVHRSTAAVHRSTAAVPRFTMVCLSQFAPLQGET